MNKGGTVTPIGAMIKIHMVPAEHSSSEDLLSLKPESTGPRYAGAGAAVGYVIELENGFKIYFTGDTDVFGDMALINHFYKPDLALVCIGGHFTMDPEHAAYAMRELVRPKQVIPMHYGTLPVLNRNPAEFKAALGDAHQGARDEARRHAQVLRAARARYCGTPALARPSTKRWASSGRVNGYQ